MYFQIKILNRSNRVEVRLNFQIDQKKDNILLLIKNFLGGNISYNKLKDEYTYNSSSYGSARNIISYFDHYHLLSKKHIHFLKWRKSYICVQNGNFSGIAKYYKTLGSKPNGFIINDLKLLNKNLSMKWA